jgi:SWI/SNF-related matrix-associated actin-dependent regulator 1 of chromatin subfamily A
VSWLSTPYLGQTVEHIPGLRVVNQGTTIKATMDAFAVVQMRHPEFVPPVGKAAAGISKPIGLHTDERLRPYQRDGIGHLALRLRNDGGTILADDMGLGKTLQTCATWDAMNRPWPLLVVAPASVRRGWVKEFQKWLGVTPRLVETGKKAADTMPGEGVVITSYELVSKLPVSFVPHMIVIDEAHLLRGRRAKRSEALLERAGLASYRLALSGTPMWGRPRDLWMLLKVLFPDYRFGNANEFDYAYCGAFINKWGGKENKGVTRPEELRKRLGYVMLRRTKQEVGNQLPSLTRVIRWVPAEKRATQALQAFALGQLKLSDAVEATLQAKLGPVVDAVSELEGHAVVFTWQKKDAHELGRLIEEEGFGVRVITGDLTHAQRQSAVEQAAREKLCVVATIDSTGTGVDGLQHVASDVIFHALDYTPIKMAQAESRAHRLGQDKPVTALYFAMENSADRLIVEKVVDKLDAWRETMGKDSTADMNDVMAAPQTAEMERRAIQDIYDSLQDTEEEE